MSYSLPFERRLRVFVFRRFSPDGSRIVTASDDRTARMTGHRSLEMLKTYSRNAEAFVGHAGDGPLIPIEI